MRPSNVQFAFFNFQFAISPFLLLGALLSAGCHDNSLPPDVAAAYSNAASNLDDYDPNVEPANYLSPFPT
ncbi:MAG: hypothetical protein IID44_04755, partial [Planctomycetes bacterium]|nr:hypothetical protein [Planctomycetota bacterium]